MSASNAIRIAVIFGTIIIAPSASASPIAGHATFVAVSPPGHFENGPLFKTSASGLDDVLGFYRGIDESLLPDGYFVRGNGVALFHAGPSAPQSVYAASTVLAFQPNNEAIVNPEPASLVLLGTGLLLVVKLRSLRRSNRPRA